MIPKNSEFAITAFDVTPMPSNVTDFCQILDRRCGMQPVDINTFGNLSA